VSKPQFNELLSELEVPIETLMLDPNNPRLMGATFESVPEDRISRDGMQRRTLRKLNEGAHDLDSLRASIQRSGLMPVDRIVVRLLKDQTNAKGEPLYVLVEGNRRIAAVKTLLQQDNEDEIELEDSVRTKLESPTVLVLGEEKVDQARVDQWVIQGVRHISGIRPWGGYQVAKTIQAMIEELGYDEREVAAALTLGLSRVRRALRVLSALDQMQDDEEWGEYAEPDLYAYFDEAIRRRTVRDWLGWDVDKWVFTDEERLHMFYSWVSPDDELNGACRLPSSDYIRQLDPVIESEAGTAVLSTPGNNINDALAVARPIVEPEWRDPIKRAITALSAMPTNVLEDLGDDDRKLIEEIRDIAMKRLKIADDFKTG